MKRGLFIASGVFILIIVGYCFVLPYFLKPRISLPMDSVATNTALSGAYVCLPYLDKAKAPPVECVFGLKTDDGEYYMVNFGAADNAMTEFQNGAYIRAKGLVVLKEALNTDQWAPYNMKGIFTIVKMLK
jgi:hypothetical protein